MPRPQYRRQIEGSLRQFRITALLGPRQCGKTTLAREFVTDPDNYFDLEDPQDIARLQLLGRCSANFTDSSSSMRFNDVPICFHSCASWQIVRVRPPASSCSAAPLPIS